MTTPTPTTDDFIAFARAVECAPIALGPLVALADKFQVTTRVVKTFASDVARAMLKAQLAEKWPPIKSASSVCHNQQCAESFRKSECDCCGAMTIRAQQREAFVDAVSRLIDAKADPTHYGQAKLEAAKSYLRQALENVLAS